MGKLHSKNNGVTDIIPISWECVLYYFISFKRYMYQICILQLYLSHTSGRFYIYIYISTNLQGVRYLYGCDLLLLPTRLKIACPGGHIWCLIWRHGQGGISDFYPQQKGTRGSPIYPGKVRLGCIFAYLVGLGAGRSQQYSYVHVCTFFWKKNPQTNQRKGAPWYTAALIWMFTSNFAPHSLQHLEEWMVDLSCS